jgi:hypothetical protein
MDAKIRIFSYSATLIIVNNSGTAIVNSEKVHIFAISN